LRLQAAASEADKLHAAITAEVEVLRLRVRALTATNTNLRRRVKDLESQPPKAAS
jgi:cell division protein FtsB